jgi:hypothetical protein
MKKCMAILTAAILFSVLFTCCGSDAGIPGDTAAALEPFIIPSAVAYIGVNAFEDCGSLFLHCNSGSYAAGYAKSNGIRYDIIK